jgi:tRNA pseudouridine38-40 synthase
MARYFLTLSYNGSDFNGWQAQLNTPNTVQQVLEEKISMLLREKITFTGCGRTDTGVNAKNYTAHFDSHEPALIQKKSDWIHKFNNILPDSIAVSDIKPVIETAHARFHATQRVYNYYLAQTKDPFRRAFTWYVYGNLDFDLMNKAAAFLMEYKDFTSFSKLNTQNKTNNCEITRAVWHKCGENEWRFTISADRFLRGMVRAIVGTLVLVGKNKLSLQQFRQIIETRDRNAAGMNAPANALFLTGIKYPKELYV